MVQLRTGRSTTRWTRRPVPSNCGARADIAAAIAVFAEERDPDMLAEARNFLDALIGAADQRLARRGRGNQRVTATLLRLVTLNRRQIIVIAVMGVFGVHAALNYTRDLVAARQEGSRRSTPISRGASTSARKSSSGPMRRSSASPIS